MPLPFQNSIQISLLQQLTRLWCRAVLSSGIIIFLLKLLLIFHVTSANAYIANYSSCGSVRVRCGTEELEAIIEQCRYTGQSGCHAVIFSYAYGELTRPIYRINYYTSLYEVPPEHRSSDENQILLEENPLLGSDNNNGLSCNNTSYPINIATGNKFFQETDYIGEGLNPLQLTLYYNSNHTPSVHSDRLSLWDYYYSQNLIITPEAIRAARPDGSSLLFSVNNGVITQPSHRLESLTTTDNGYELRLPNNTLERYTSEGTLVAIRYATGIEHTINYSYDRITITRLNQLLVLNLEDGDVISATLPDGVTIEYEYSVAFGFKRLDTVNYSGTQIRSYIYESTARPYIVGIEDNNGSRIASVEYDSQGRATSSEVGTPSSGIERTQIQSHNDGTRTVTNSLGKQSTYNFTQFNGEYKITQIEGHASTNCAAANQAYTYDSNGFMSSKTDWQGNVTTYTHNNRGLEISRTEASGTPEARTIVTEWHPTFNLRTKIIEPEREVVFSYDANRQLISQEMNLI